MIEKLRNEAIYPGRFQHLCVDGGPHVVTLTFLQIIRKEFFLGETEWVILISPAFAKIDFSS